MTNPQCRITQAEQAKQLLKMISMIRATCPAGLQGDVFPMLDQLEESQSKLDELLIQMSESPLIGATLEDIKEIEDLNSKRYEEHTAIALQMQETLGKVLALVQK